MAVTGGSGMGATLTLATTGISFKVKKLSLPEWAIESIEATYLGTTVFKEYVRGDLAEPGELEAEIVFETSVAPPTPDNWDAETVTVTFPLRSGESTAATLTGTGFINKFGFPELAIDELQMTTLGVQFDGDTGPSFTVGS